MRWKYKTLICKSFSRVNDFPQNFVVDERPTTSFPPALNVTDNYACAPRLSKQPGVLVLVFVLVLGSKGP